MCLVTLWHDWIHANAWPLFGENADDGKLNSSVAAIECDRNSIATHHVFEIKIYTSQYWMFELY